MAEAKASCYEEIGGIKRKNNRVKGKFKNKWTRRIADTSNIDYSKKNKKDEDNSSSDSSETETSFLKVIRDIKRKLKPVKRKLKTRQARTDTGNLCKSRKKSNAVNVNDSKKKEDEDNSK